MTTPAPRSFRGGIEELQRIMAVTRMETQKILPVVEPRPNEKAGSIASYHFELGLFDLWEGNADGARMHFEIAAETWLRYVNLFRDRWSAPEWVANNTRDIVHGAIIANLIGRTELSRTLFEEAALIGSGVVRSGQDLAPDVCEYIHDPTAENPLHHLYALIRLGRFSGFKTAVYTAPWPEARRTKPQWMETDVRTVLRTAEIVMASSRSTRTHVFTTEAELVIMLDKLLTCLEHPDDKAARAAAQKRLGIFYNKIANMADFYGIYPLVLDLQTAFPHIFNPVVPNPLHVG